MGMLNKLAKAGVAKKLMTEARKPQNQAKARDMMTKVKTRRAGTTAGRPPR